MWIITAYLDGKIKMFEFETEKEALEVYKSVEGSKFLSQIVYYNDPCFAS